MKLTENRRSNNSRAPTDFQEHLPHGKIGKGYLTGSLARIEVFGLLHAVLERETGEGFFCRLAAQPCPLLFGDPESGFYPRFPLRRPREDISRFLVEALRLHRSILPEVHGPGPSFRQWYKELAPWCEPSEEIPSGAMEETIS